MKWATEADLCAAGQGGGQVKPPTRAVEIAAPCVTETFWLTPPGVVLSDVPPERVLRWETLEDLVAQGVTPGDIQRIVGTAQMFGGGIEAAAGVVEKPQEAQRGLEWDSV